MYRAIVDKIRDKDGDFIIELKANQRALRYGVEDSLPVDTPALGRFIRNHWSIESMHWCLDCNHKQDKVKRKSAKAARNLDTIQRILHSLFSIWEGRRRKSRIKGRVWLNL